MPNYITFQDLLDELGENKLVQLTAVAGSKVINVTVVNNAIDSAEGTFESYIRTRYTLPVPITRMVKTRCLHLAIYELYRNRSSFDDGVFKVKKTAFDETISFLRDVQKGYAALDIPAVEETTVTPATGDRILTNANRSKFTDKKMSGY